MKTEITFGEWLKNRRRALDLTQKELAQEVGYSVGTIRKIESNERRPSKQMASLLAEPLGIAQEQQDAFIAFARTERYSADATSLPLDFGVNFSGLAPQAHVPIATQQMVAAYNLPSQTTPFIGRESELAALDELLGDPAVRLITIVGPGGIGKTRLAIESAARQNAKFAHGVHFVPLTPLASAGQLVQTIMEALKLSFSSGDDLKAQLLRYLRTKQMLLLMDNFEHLLADARLLNEILETAPGVTILTTSREKLNLTGETVFSVVGLEYADWQTVEEALSNSAAQLFIQGAQRARPEFVLSQEDVRPLAQICQLVEGMPLGILLAAAWVDLLSPEEIAAEIGKSLDFLEVELRDMPARQRSLRAVFETSWERLTQAERDLFKTLSLFRGGFTREAARKVARASLRDLAGLDNKSFLRRDHGSGRYEVHELLRQYAEERLETLPEVTEAAHESHATYFANFMDMMSQELRSGRQMACLDEIESDIENVRASWRYLAARGNSAEIAKIVDSLWYFHEIRGWYHAGVALFGEAEATLLAISNDEDTMVVTSQMLGARSWFMSLLGSVQQSQEMAKRSLATLRQLNRRQEQLIPLEGLAMSDYFLNQISEVIQAAQESLDIARELDDTWWEAASLSWIGSAYVATQEFDDARRYVEAADKLVSEIGDPWLSFFPSQALAQISTLQGDYITGKERYQFALEAARSVNFKRGMSYAYNYLGDVSYWLEEFVEAEPYYLQSLRINHEIGQKVQLLADLFGIAQVRAILGRGSEAIKLLAVVLQETISAQRILLRPLTIHQYAEQLRAELEETLPPEEYAMAWQSGEALELEVMVAELLG